VTRTVAVLAYHRVGPPPPGSWETWFSVPSDTFAEHLRVLDDGGWEPIGAHAFLRGLDEPESLPPRAVLVTYDDAFGSLTGAAALLGGRPAVVFVPTAFVGGANRWDADTAEPQERICDWDDLAALERAGVSVESHGVGHRAFSDLSPDEVERELTESKAELERRLGKRVSLFAFPYGDAGSADGAVARAGYEAAFLYDGSPFALPVADRFRLMRMPIGPDTDLEAELMSRRLDGGSQRAEVPASPAPERGR
jgi:peptidoglycan/xylan/chitin deacetylase (PgdA/CDA1 family)